MGFGGTETRLYKMCNWTFRLMYLHLLWILFTLGGFILFGIFPATIAMFAAIRRWLLFEEEFSLFSFFLSTYKKEWVKSNKMGAVITAVSIILAADLYLFQHGDSYLSLIMSFIIIALSAFFILTLFYLFPAYVHFDLSIRQLAKNAFFISILHPIQTVSIVISCLFIGYIWFLIPAIAVFIGAGMMPLVITKFAVLTFRKVEKDYYKEIEAT